MYSEYFVHGAQRAVAVELLARDAVSGDPAAAAVWDQIQQQRARITNGSCSRADSTIAPAVGTSQPVHPRWRRQYRMLRLTTRNGAEVSDTLKYFSERLPATFVYARINVEREGLFTGTRGRQIAGRFTLIPGAPFPYAGEWQGPVATLEDAVRLHEHPPGSLTGLDRDLHQRTGGMIGSLSHLIRAAAVEAILGGSEQITRKLLDAGGLDHAAQARPGPDACQRGPHDNASTSGGTGGRRSYSCRRGAY